MLGLLVMPGLLPGVFAQDLVTDFKSGHLPDAWVWQMITCDLPITLTVDVNR